MASQGTSVLLGSASRPLLMWSQAKDSCGIEVEQCLENKVVEKASVKGDVPQVATDLQEGASVYGMAMCWNGWSRRVSCVYTLVRCFSQYETRICGLKNLSVQCISMKYVRPTFSGGRLSYIVVLQSSGYYEIVICIPAVTTHSWSLLAVPILVNASYTWLLFRVCLLSQQQSRVATTNQGWCLREQPCLLSCTCTCEETSRL